MDEKIKYILVTGASSGIGREIAKNLSHSYNIVLNGRNIERLEDAISECSTKHQHLVFPCDLSIVDSIESDLTAFIKENNIEIIKLVHCAGFMKMIPLKMITIKNIITTFSTNIFSIALIIKVLANRRINNSAFNNAVFISSNISNFGAKAFSTYSASKAALDGLMRSLAVELAPQVRINSVLPGAVETEMTKSIFQNQEVINRMNDDYPLGLGTVTDIYEIVDFLLSAKSRWITGQQFTVDGGRTINISG